MIDSITQHDLAAKDAERIAAGFKALSEPVRLRLLNIVAANGEMCVCDLPERLGITQPTVSHHLRILTQAGLLQREKRGKWAYYTVDFIAMEGLGELLANTGN